MRPLRSATVRVLVSLAVIALPRSGFAQTGGGSVSGHVRDEQLGVLPGVVVTVKSPTAATIPATQTDSEGLYRLQNLAPGVYSVTAELDGFATFVRENVVVG